MKKILIFVMPFILFTLMFGCNETTAVSYDVEYYEVSQILSLGDSSLEAGDYVIAMDLGGNHTAALSANGTFWTWGDNERGQLGDGTTVSKLNPVDVTEGFDLQTGETLTAFAVGDKFSLALSSEGKIFSWGWNYQGRLGDGTAPSRSVPTDITPQFSLHIDETIVAIAAGDFYAGAITSEGRAFTWGENGMGQLGDGTIELKKTPTDITSQFGLEEGEILANLYLGYYHSGAITSEGRVFVWGGNAFGQLGDGSNFNRHLPVDITSQFGLETEEQVESLFLGEHHSMALTSAGRVFAWGSNADGQLGDGTSVDHWTPQDITSELDLLESETLTSAAIGFNNCMVMTSQKRVFIWGDNLWGQIGNGTTVDQNVPLDITSRFELSGSETLCGIFLHETHSVLLTSGGRIYGWGDNDEGQFGDGTTQSRNQPGELTNSTPTKTLLKTDSHQSTGTFILYEPVREGFLFSGWYLDQAMTTRFEEDMEITENIKLYGEWHPEE